MEEGECEGIGTRKGFHVCLNLNLTSDPVCTNVTQRLSLGASMLLNVCRWEHRRYSTFVARRPTLHDVRGGRANVIF